MKLFFTHKEIALKKKRTALVVIGIGLVIGIYLIVSHRPAKMPELPVVAIAPATQDDVEIYGEYVGRVRAQQFVEVRARVEGYLEQMLFAEGTYVTKNQVLFVINQDQYRAKADKARAQLKKDEAQAQKAKRGYSPRPHCARGQIPARRGSDAPARPCLLRRRRRWRAWT